MTGSIDTVSLGRHRDSNTKHIDLDLSQSVDRESLVQGDCVMSQSFNDAPILYEELIQKLENDVRIHIRHQNFLKLHIESQQHSIEMQQREIERLKKQVVDIKSSKEKLEIAYNKDMLEFKTLGQTHEKTVSELNNKISELNMFITSNNFNTLTTLDKREYTIGEAQSQNWMLKSYKRDETPKIIRNDNFSPSLNRSKSIKKRVVKLKPKNKNREVQHSSKKARNKSNPTRSLSNKGIKNERRRENASNNFLCKTERGSMANQRHIIDQINKSSKVSLALSGMAFNKNLQMKSSISRKLLKAFKADKLNNNKKSKSPEKVDSNLRSMYFSDMAKKFSMERMVNSSIPEYLKFETMAKQKR